MIENLLERLNALHPLSDELKDRLSAIAIINDYPKKTILFHEGQTANKACVILKGLTRAYYFAEDKDITSRFMDEGYIMTSWMSFFTREPGYEYFETLEDSTLACFLYNDLEKLYNEIIEFNINGRKLTEYYFYLSEQRTKMLRKNTAEEKYLFFLEQHPSLLQRVPLKHIASYLGINEETLSRVRAKMLKK